MNTVKSFWLGMGALTAGGAVAYYFAKQDINAVRKVEVEEMRQRKREQAKAEAEWIAAQRSARQAPRTDAAGSPSQEAGGQEPAPTRHAPDSENRRIFEKSKYEPTQPYITPKGDRLS